MSDNSAYFYHASPVRNLISLQPQAKTRPYDFDGGPVVWATPSLPFATEFIVACDDSLTKGGAYGEICYLIIGDRIKYESLDIGGMVYVLSPENFKHFRGHEWYSFSPVLPIRKIEYNSGVQAMIENGVQVFFPQPEIFDQIKAGADHLDIIRKLVSENQKLGINYNKI